MRVSGGCWLNENDDAYFDIYAETATVPFSIPTTDEPTAQQGYPCAKASSAAAPTILEILRPILLTLLLIFLGTLIYLMNRRLREQERFQESIREQLSNLSHIARLNTLSEMVGVLAHKLNQPLASVSNYAATAEVLSKKEPTGSEKLAGVLTSISGKRSERARSSAGCDIWFVRRLPARCQSTSLKSSPKPSSCSKRNTSPRAALSRQKQLPTVQTDSVQIQQVVLNLLLNA